ncbi:thiamine ABC transporter substrate binding subunit [Nocardioides sp. R-C-SC26]|uniref:thiamine ABC transporter substrate-binding protein n=1 Tax=Nocardioides sp. R-C-SC26 TaxID=2870414 RepID=UPI001E543C83|nr:thiamine ABC transporter substrate-binding protein [Nocardioides sp. R-C-SC26]
MFVRALTRKAAAVTAVSALGITALSACSFVTEEGEASGTSEHVVLLTHGDFYLPEDLTETFEADTGYVLDVRPSDGVGDLANLVADEAGKPSGDVVFGVDSTFASRVLEAGAVAPFAGELPDGVADYALAGDDDGALVGVDSGNVCVNVDTAWFDAEGMTPPTTFADLTEPAYRGLFAIPGASTSSPGMAFLLGTIAEFGDDWSNYWADLMANDALVVNGWSDAYNVEFTAGEGGGDRPIVVSYDSSPAFTVADGATGTAALLDTCVRQVEYAGVLEGADNPEGAADLVEFLVSQEVQAALPESMYVFPTRAGVELPTDWATFAQRPSDPLMVDPAEIEANREDWLLEWTDVVSR